MPPGGRRRGGSAFALGMALGGGWLGTNKAGPRMCFAVARHGPPVVTVHYTPP